MSKRRYILLVAAGWLLAVDLFAAALTSRPEDWQPLSLLGMLIVLACGSELLGLKIRDLRVSGSFLAIVLAMALLGPAPAVLVGVLCSAWTAR